MTVAMHIVAIIIFLKPVTIRKLASRFTFRQTTKVTIAVETTVAHAEPTAPNFGMRKKLASMFAMTPKKYARASSLCLSNAKMAFESSIKGKETRSMRRSAERIGAAPAYAAPKVKTTILPERSMPPTTIGIAIRNMNRRVRSKMFPSCPLSV